MLLLFLGMIAGSVQVSLAFNIPTCTTFAGLLCFSRINN
jgi:hypothetical protein